MRKEDQRVSQGWTRDRSPRLGRVKEKEGGMKAPTRTDIQGGTSQESQRARLRESQTEVHRVETQVQKRETWAETDIGTQGRDRYAVAQTGRWADRPRRRHCLSMGTQAEARSWKAGHAKHEAETSGS